MSKGGGGGGSTTTVQKADPWSGLQGPLSRLYGGAENWFNSSGPSFYPGSTVAPTNADIESALNMGSTQAGSGMPGYLTTGANTLTTTAAGRSLRDNPGFNQQEAFANGSMLGTNPAQGTFQNFASGGYVGSNPATNYFSDAAGGKFLTNQTNPYLNGLYHNATDPMVQQFQQAIAPGIASQFSAAGRTGSGANLQAFNNATDTLGRGLGAAASSIFGNAYEQERARQQAAAGTLADIGSQERAQQLQGASQLGALNQAERGMQLKGAEDLSSAYGLERSLGQSAALALPQYANQVQQIGFDKAAKQLGIGQYRQQQAQDLINAERERYDYNQNLPLQKLQALNQLLQGGSAYATQTSKGSSALNRNPFTGAIGGAAMSNALGGMFGGDIGGALMGPMGLLGGALLGGLFG